MDVQGVCNHWSYLAPTSAIGASKFRCLVKPLDHLPRNGVFYPVYCVLRLLSYLWDALWSLSWSGISPFRFQMKMKFIPRDHNNVSPAHAHETTDSWPRPHYTSECPWILSVGTYGWPWRSSWAHVWFYKRARTLARAVNFSPVLISWSESVCVSVCLRQSPCLRASCVSIQRG